MKKYKNYINENIDDDDEDFNFLDNLIGRSPEKDIPIKEPAATQTKQEPRNFIEGDRVVYYKDGSSYDGLNGIFAGKTKEGKAVIAFNVENRRTPDGAHLPTKMHVSYSNLYRKGTPRPVAPKTTSNFKKDDLIVYNKEGSGHNNKTGKFIEVREDGKYSIRFDDGTRLACNPNNVKSLTIKINKEDFIIRLSVKYQCFGDVKKDGIYGEITLDSGEIYDESFLYQYPELKSLGFIEFDKDEYDKNSTYLLKYNGSLTIYELQEDLTERGFLVEILQ